MIIRVQSPDGTKRIEFNEQESTSSLLNKVQEAFNLPSVYSFSLFTDKNRQKEILNLERRNVRYYNLKHGDMVYLSFRNNHEATSGADNGTTTTTAPSSRESSTSEETTKPPHQVDIDEVDQILYRTDGSIKRPRDDRLCRHGDKGRCIHCIPLEPYDENYLKEQNIKHLSFHAYLRKLAGGVDRGKFTALEYERCTIKASCRDHPPWPQAKCTKCQPSAVTLNRQPYRHVDNVAFDNPHLVDRFLDYWRLTGHQRLGFLYGRYEVHKDVPLGIKACVSAIYEPPQEGSSSQLVLLPDDKEALVEWVASKLGLRRVGWIFTDLEAMQRTGAVRQTRGADTYFLSADECILAGHLQNLHPNPVREASEGHFGSKFVTVCVTGDKDNQVHMEGYQVSNQCMALVRDKCLIPTKDAPELGYIKESTQEQYVPDVYFKGKDSYNNEVTQVARPFPIEYLLVDVPASMPVEPQFTFYSASNITPFPVENRMLEGHIQDFAALAKYLRQFQGEQFLQAMSDLHLLVYIAQMDMLPLRDHMEPLLEAVRTQDPALALSWARSQHWATVEHLLTAQESGSVGGEGRGVEVAGSLQGGSSSAAGWTCAFCTFINQPGSPNCAMCSLPPS